MKARVCAVLFACFLAVSFGCRQRPVSRPAPVGKDYERQLPPGASALRKITDPRLIPDFTPAFSDLSGLRESIAFSLNYLGKPSSLTKFPRSGITHGRAVESLEAFEALISSGRSAREMNEELRGRFDVYTSVGCDHAGTVLFTCYYTPLFDASPVRSERFRWPLYKMPPDLVKRPDGSPSIPLPDRKTIETSGMYAGNELVWMEDPFEAFVVQIQGSCRLRMPDGREMMVGYAAHNGHENRSVRAELVKDGKIGKRDGLPAMLAYFKAHPGDVMPYTWRNPRYIFFRTVEDGRARGCLNEPVTARRTIATDKSIFPPGCLTFLSTALPQRRGGRIVNASCRTFALDQDAGGAIRAPGRCDLYLGTGDEAGELAGRAQNEGRLYYLFLKGEGGRK